MIMQLPPIFLKLHTAANLKLNDLEIEEIEVRIKLRDDSSHIMSGPVEIIYQCGNSEFVLT